jgi:hypothetical protein
VLDDVNRDAVRVPVSSTNGMNSHRLAGDGVIDIQHDVPTTLEDVEVLRRLRRETSSWFLLSPAEFEALLPEDALDRCPVMQPDALPFTLP